MNGSTDYIDVLGQELRARPTGLVIFESTIYVIMFIATIIGNFLTLLIIFRSPVLRRVSTNIFIATLALSDFTMGCLSMHLLVVVLITSEWPFGELVCQYQGYVAVVLAAASTQTLAWTAVNRYYRVCRSTQFNQLFSANRIKLIILQIWTSSLIAPLPYVLAGNMFVFNPGKFFCYLSIDTAWFTVLLVIVYVGLPSAVISWCYFKVYKLVNKNNQRISQLRASSQTLSVEEIRTTHTLFVIVVVFMCCWTPVLIIDVIDTFRGKLSLSRTVYFFYTFLASVSYAINPLIYGIMNPTLRGQYFAVLLCKKQKGKRYSTERRQQKDVIDVLPYETATKDSSF